MSSRSMVDVLAVNDLNLEIRDKEFLVLVGPSGCGKSTALRMIAGLEEITGGILRIGDRVVNNVPPKDRDIAMVFQSYALYPHMTRLRQHGLRPAHAQAMPQAGCRSRGGHQTAQSARSGIARRESAADSLGLTSTSTASRASSPAASASAWRWGAPSSASRRSS